MASTTSHLTRFLVLSAALANIGGCDDGPAPGPTPVVDASPSTRGFDPMPTGTSDSGTDAGPAAPPSQAADDPCKGESAEGSCPTPGLARSCVTPTGNASPELVQTTCQSYERCTQTRYGVVACAPMEGACEPGASACDGTNRINVCKDARWQSLECPGGCLQTALGDFCRLQVESTPYQASVQYAAHGPNADMTDWSPTPFTAPAQSLVVASFRGDDVIDADITAADGSFTVQVPSMLGPDDRVIVLAVHPTDSKTGLAIAIGKPDAPDGELNPHAAADGRPQIWQWSIDPARNPSGSTLTIGDTEGGGAVRLFDNLRRVYRETRGLLKTEGKPLVVWLRPNTAFTCGACQFVEQAKVGPVTFFVQIAIGADAKDTAFWSDAVISHELFHWVMSSYGVSPGEGGAHCIGRPTQPGMAWSEGWATGFSSIIRDSPIYYDKQEGTFFWFDIARRFYGRGKTWKRPTAAAGLEQPHDENDVASMLYALSRDPAVGSQKMLLTLGSPRMTQKPFLRGYTTHRWQLNDCVATNITNTSLSAPYLADFLDALRCGGVPADRIDAVTEPGTYYPFPSQSPLCR